MESSIKNEKTRVNALYSLFCQQYRKQFEDDRWDKTLLPALMAPTRYCCLVNRFADPKAVLDRLSEIDPANQENSKPNQKYQQLNFIQSTPCLYLPVHEKNASALPFPSPVRDFNTGRLTHYLLDAASVFVTEILNPQPGERILDLCSAPGGKSLAIAQRLLTVPSKSQLVCNEILPERRKRLFTVLTDYLGPDKIQSVKNPDAPVKITGHDGTHWSKTGMTECFDKCLVDAPCSSERHLIHNKDDLLSWTEGHSKVLAQKQVQLLLSAIEAVRSGGMVIYATCSLSQTENDMVVKKAFKKSKFPIQLVSERWKLWPETHGGQKRFPIGEATEFGWIVLPDSSSSHESCDSWGPLYFACIRKQ